MLNRQAVAGLVLLGVLANSACQSASSVSTAQTPNLQATVAAAVEGTLAAVPTQPRAELPTLVAPTATPVAPTATVLRQPTLTVALDEAFGRSPQSWPDDVDSVAWYADDKYQIAPRGSGQFVAIGAPIAGSLGDGVVSGRFHKTGGPAGGGYGLIVRDQGPFPRDGISQNGRFVVFEVGDDATIGAWQRDSDHWVDLVPWRASAAVRAGNEVNELSVRLAGEVLVFQVNGQPVAQVHSTLTNGAAGVFVGGDGNLVALERFTIQAPGATDAVGALATFTPVPPTPTPPATPTPLPATATPVPAEEPVVLQGSQDFTSKPFTLRGGNYSVAWRGLPTSEIGCIFGAFLDDASNRGGGEFSHTSNDGQTFTAETQLYGIKPGEYHIKVISTCDLWMVAIVPSGGDATAALGDAPTPRSASGPAAGSGSATSSKWALTFLHSAVASAEIVSNEYGTQRVQAATGEFLAIIFNMQNKQTKSSPVVSTDFTLSDKQGRTYRSDFEVRQVLGSTSEAYGGSGIAPGASVQLSLTFDVTPDATGLVMHVRGGNDIAVK